MVNQQRPIVKRPNWRNYYLDGYTVKLEEYCDGLERAISKLMDQIDLYTKDSPLEKLSREEWLTALMEDEDE